MQIGMVGLGRMGGNMARRLMRGGHEVVAYARTAKTVQEVAGTGAVGTVTLDDFVAKLKAPRVAWVMVPAGGGAEQIVVDHIGRGACRGRGESSVGAVSF